MKCLEKSLENKVKRIFHLMQNLSLKTMHQGDYVFLYIEQFLSVCLRRGAHVLNLDFGRQKEGWDHGYENFKQGREER